MRKGDKRARQSFIKETKKKGKAVKFYPLLVLSIQMFLDAGAFNEGLLFLQLGQNILTETSKILPIVK